MYITDVFTQTLILLYKDALMVSKSWVLTLARLIIPCVAVVCCILLVIGAPNLGVVSDPEPGPVIGNIPKCAPYVVDESQPCVTFYWSVELTSFNDTAAAIVQAMCDANDPKLTMGEDVQYIAEAPYVARYLYETAPNSTYGIINFDQISTVDGNYMFNYTIFYNGTSVESMALTRTYPQVLYFPNNYLYHFENLIERGIMSYLAPTGVTPTLQVQLKPFPATIGSGDLGPMSWNLAMPIIYIGVTFTIVIELIYIISEKESGIRGSLIIGGLHDLPYWLSTIIRQCVIGFVAIVIMSLFGWLIPKMIIFHEANLFALILIFSAYVWNMSCFLAMFSTLLSKRKAANIWACIIFSVGLFLCFGVIVFVDTLVYWTFYSSAGFLIQFVPVFNFAKTLLDVKYVTVGALYDGTPCFDLQPTYYSMETFFNFPVYPPSYDGGECDFTVPSTFITCLWMVLEGFVFLILTAWWDKVLPDANKATLPFFFFLMPSFYRRSPQAMRDAEQHALIIENLSKTYRKNICAADGNQALRPFQLTCPNSTIMCMLGPNGAGKSTTISCLTGLTPPSEGEAFIFGYSIASQLSSIRKIMGVCPQFDVLWDNLTAWQHMKIFNKIKPGKERMTDAQLLDRLAEVRLDGVANKQAGKYSGGMKRRLSVVLSTIGDPKVLFLDEPTTGMDPDNRRYVWDLIRKIKKDKLIILTTHSMEEADMLGDRIAIIAAGKLRVEGTAMELKRQFGLGYRVTLSTSVERVPELKQYVFKHLPGAQLRSDNAGALVYSLPDVDPDESVAEFFQFLQDNSQQEGRLVDDWGIQNTTIEDVFMTVSRKIMGQDIVFTGDSKNSQLDRDDREMFRATTQRFEQRFRYLQKEVASLRELLDQHGISSTHILSAHEEISLLEQ